MCKVGCCTHGDPTPCVLGQSSWPCLEAVRHEPIGAGGGGRGDRDPSGCAVNPASDGVFLQAEEWALKGPAAVEEEDPCTEG